MGDFKKFNKQVAENFLKGATKTNSKLVCAISCRENGEFLLLQAGEAPLSQLAIVLKKIVEGIEKAK